MLIGLTGRMGAGKDTVCERIVALLAAEGERGCRFSFADPLKQSVCKLFGLTREELEEWKLSEGAFLLLGPHREDGEEEVKVDGYMTMRMLLQRYGTEAHREVFGDTFWVDLGIRAAVDHRAHYPTHTQIFTDVRFDNEAYAILMEGGRVFEVVGPEGPTSPDAEHASERGLRRDLLTGGIMNDRRDGDMAYLDANIKAALGL
jgi:hypothetical protein